MSDRFSIRFTLKQWCCLLAVGMALYAGKASALKMKYSNLSNGYSNCSYVSNGNGTSTVKVSISYKQAAGHAGSLTYVARGIILYSYNAKGGLNVSSNIARALSVGGVAPFGAYQGEDYYIYYNVWGGEEPFTADVVIVFNDSDIAQWPALGVRAGNFTSGEDVGDSAGLAYITPSTKGGICTLLANPGLPPPPVDVTLTMTAPDWDMGELSRDKETITTLGTPKDQLCFSYEGAKYVVYQKYIINATNVNGLSDNGRYLLTSLEDSLQTIPYSLTLQSTTDTVLLPNIKNAVFTLSNSGRTCFTPTFKTLVAKWAKGGAYSDVLTFTVVAKP